MQPQARGDLGRLLNARHAAFHEDSVQRKNLTNYCPITANEGELPQFPNGYRRHGITRFSADYLDPNVGMMDLDAITSTWNRNLRTKVYGGGVRESSYDGTEFEQAWNGTLEVVRAERVRGLTGAALHRDRAHTREE